MNRSRHAAGALISLFVTAAVSFSVAPANAALTTSGAGDVRDCYLGIYDFPEIEAKGVPCSDAKQLIRKARRADWSGTSKKTISTFTCKRSADGQVIYCAKGAKWVRYNVRE